LARRTHELINFLTNVAKVKSIGSRLDKTLTYHDSCSGLRELGIEHGPRQLLKSIAGLELREMKDAQVCCGFGGTFCVKFPDISNDMVSKKTGNIKATEADILAAGDLGCLMNMAGKLAREGAEIEVRHIAEILAGELDKPGIGAGDKDR
jgi:L-lactate dehydrogenase complex protein LldE